MILITMGRYNPEQTEAARACGATGWQAFWHVEFPLEIWEHFILFNNPMGTITNSDLELAWILLH